MRKLKSNKGARKRLRLTKKGLLRRWRPGRRHILTKKSSDRKRHLSKPAFLEGMEKKIIKKLLPYG